MSRRSRRIYAAITTVLILASLYTALRLRPETTLVYDPAYWAAHETRSGPWYGGVTPAGIAYSLFIPPEADRADAASEVPLITVFHGSADKAAAKERYGGLFISGTAQAALGPKGAAVLVLYSRVEYFSDPPAYSRLIRNVILRHGGIDGHRIAGWGFSQGAAFVEELAMYDPLLFRAVAAGSSYYKASPAEILRAARVRFWCALSKNDQGIYGQGASTAKMLSLLCPDSRFVEYENRGHFFIEPRDLSGRGKETFLSWLTRALK